LSKVVFVIDFGVLAEPWNERKVSFDGGYGNGKLSVNVGMVFCSDGMKPLNEFKVPGFASEEHGAFAKGGELVYTGSLRIQVLANGKTPV
jgi:hypothetical protein